MCELLECATFIRHFRFHEIYSKREIINFKMPLIDYSPNLVRTNETKKNGQEDVLLLFTKRSPICFQLDCVTISFNFSKLIFVIGGVGGVAGERVNPCTTTYTP